ncbi:MAG: SIS domain-containing protein [Lachnospiraceae bacterium]|nr:SIS domain-containing protein [Lachnospiraceae bacterium]
MEPKIAKILDNLTERYPVLNDIRDQIADAYEVMKDCYDHDGKLLIAGNGGSCADADHIVGELMKTFIKRRPVSKEFRAKLKEADPENGDTLADKLGMSLMALSLSNQQTLNTAFSNDVDGDYIYAQQVLGYGRPGDVYLAISTSGNSRNILHAVPVAKALGIKVIGLTGRKGGKLKNEADVAILAPADETYKIQELHLPIYHALCLMLEDTYFEE